MFLFKFKEVPDFKLEAFPSATEPQGRALMRWRLLMADNTAKDRKGRRILMLLFFSPSRGTVCAFNGALQIEINIM